MTWKGWEDYKGPGAAVLPNSKPQIPSSNRSHKYGAIPQWVLADLRVVRAEPTALPAGALWFQSKREADRFVALRLELEARAISDLRLQPQFPLNVVTVSGVRVVIGRWIGDFAYLRDGHEVIEDAKGVRTDLYKWKLAHVEAQYGIRIREV